MGRQSVTVESMCHALRTTPEDLAETLGLGRLALSHAHELQPSSVSERLGEFAQILERLESMTGNAVMAYAYYRAQGIPEFGGRTAEGLVREGKACQVRRYLDHVEGGGFA